MYESLQYYLATLPPDGRERLERLLNRMSLGYKVDLRTPFFDEAPRDQVAEACDQAIGRTQFPDYEAINIRQREKMGSDSIMLPSAERKLDWEKYGAKYPWNPDESSLRRAFETVASTIAEGSLRPLSYMESYERAPKDTWRGVPWCVNSRDYDDWYVKQAMKARSWEEIGSFVLGWRGQSQGLHEIPKQRVVAMASKVEGIKHGRLLYPYLEAARKTEGHSAWFSEVEVDRAITNQLTKARGRTIISGDFAGMDQTISNPWFEILRVLYKRWFIPEVHADLDIMIDHAENARLVVPGAVYARTEKGSELSGREFTNCDDTNVSDIAYEYVAERAGTSVRSKELLGDDAVVTYEEDIDPLDISRFLGELGLESNPEKIFTSTDACHYLQRWHSLRYLIGGVAVGCHPPFRTLGHSLNLERWRPGWNKWMFTARLIMQTENCKNDPRFKDYVLFIKQGDKILSSGVDPAEVFRKAGGAEEVRKVLDIASFPFNQQDPDKVEIFRTTEVLRELNHVGLVF